jgi:serine/threonine protein kinase
MGTSELVGKTLGDFEVEELVGKGSMAQVFKARQISLRRPVALKILEEGLFTPHDNIKRFVREAEAMARLEHPHVVPVYAAGEETPYYFFAMRLIRGGSLGEAMRNGVQQGLAIRWAYEVCQALAYAHSMGVVHRDLKPSNVLIQEGSAVLGDFGLARLKDMSTITQRGFVLGTPLYMSPEQTLGEETGPPSDCFSLGVILYELMLGAHPFAAHGKKGVSRIEARAELFQRIQKAEFTAPSDVQPTFPMAIEHVIMRSLQRRPETRFPDGAAMLKELEAAYRALPMEDRIVQVAPHESGTPPAVRDTSAMESTAAIEPPPSSTGKPAQEKFGRYEIRKEIGHGGQGVVYKAYDPVLDRDVALKVMQQHHDNIGQMAELFAHEARVAARLAHPHIIHIYDFGVHEHSPFLTMQLVNGPSLDQLLEPRKPLPLAYALQVLLQTAEALALAHESGVAHLDVKPGNILIGPSTREFPEKLKPQLEGRLFPHVLLTDFTMAALRQVDAASESQKKHAKKSGLTAGTIPYASPEQLGEGGTPGPASDLFSLGVVFYEMLTGERLFSGEHLSVTQLLVLRGNVPLPSSKNASLPPEVDTLCHKMLVRNVKDRVQTALEVLRQARAILDNLEK